MAAEAYTVAVDPDRSPMGVHMAAPPASAVELASPAGGTQTCATARDEALPGDCVMLGATVAAALEVTAGETVQVTPREVRTARAVTVRPLGTTAVDVSAETVTRLLRDAVVEPGERVDLQVSGGAISVPLRIERTDPMGAVAITAETDVTVGAGTGGSPLRPAGDPGPVGGYGDAHAALSEALLAAMATPAPRTGLLVTGPTGVGKSHLVGAACATAALDRVVVDLPQLLEMSAADRDRLLGGLTARGEPVVVHLPDLPLLADATAAARQQVATIIDRLHGLPQRVVVGEARQPELIDPPLRAGTRLGQTVALEQPTAADRRAILTQLLPAAVDEQLCEQLTAQTVGYVAADLIALRTALVRTTAGFDDDTLSSATVTAAVDATTPIGSSPLDAVPDVTFADVGGLADPKRQLRRAVEWPLRYGERLEELGIETPAGVLLYGPPGTGKTLLARAVAATTEANFLRVDGPELLNKFVGESERAVRELFDRAREAAPVVIFFDELDAIGGVRTETGGSQAPARVVSQLLTELDGLTPRADVVVLGATNRPDMIDPALLRPGRFDRQVEVPIPDDDARAEIIAIHMREGSFADVDVDALTDATAGLSGSAIAATLQEARLLAFEAAVEETDAAPSSVTVTQADVDAALAQITAADD
jgi:transitional endoplasmic reticulum ATPase